LRSDIQAYTENDSQEFQDALDRIIENVEIRVYREADLNVFRKTATASLTASDRFLAKPTDYVVDRYLKITVGTDHVDLIAKDVSFLQTFWPTAAATGAPRYYADWDHDTFILAPTPDSIYTATLGYTYRPDSLVTTGTTSWVGDNAPDCLLYGCLVEAYGFMKLTENTNDLTFWKEQYDRALASLKFEEEKRQRREAYRYGEIK
jgi:hypothetical protein